MSSWLTTDDVADLLEISARAVRQRAKRNGWEVRRVPAPHGGREMLEYHVDSLPRAAKEALAMRIVQDVVGEGDAAEAQLARRLQEEGRLHAAERRLAEVDRLLPTGRRRMEARLWALDALERFARAARLSVPQARQPFADAVNDGEMAVPDEHRKGLGTKMSERSLARWASTRDKEGPAALAGRYGRRSERDYDRTITLENELGRLVLGMLAQRGRHLGAHALHQQALAHAITGRLPMDVGDVPSVKTFERFLAWLEAERPTTWAHLVSPHTAKGTVMPAFGRRDEAVTRINQIWELDSTLADVVLEDLDGKTGEVVKRRFALVACVDVFSRRVRFLVSDRSASDSIAAVFRRCLLEWGVPGAVRTDNGKDYTSKHLELVFDEMGVERELCRPYSGDEKPFVERVIGTLQHDGMFKLLPGYAGHDVATRKELDARRRRTAAGEPPLQLGEVPMDRAQFQTFVDDWAGRVYAHREHSSLGCTPFERAGQGGRVRRIRNEEVLSLLMARPAGSRGGLFKVQKRGIEYKPPELSGARARFYFIAPELVADQWIGREVRCREDLTDLGRLHVSEPDTGAFVCWAACPELADVDRKAVAVRAKTAYNEERQRLVADAKRAARDYSAEEALEAVREQHAERTGEAKIAARIVPEVEHDAPALRHAEQAVRSRTASRPTIEATADELAAAERVAAEADARRQREAEREQAEAERGEAVLYQLSTDARSRLYRNDDERYVALLERADRLSDDEKAFIETYERAASGRGATGSF